MSKLVLMIAIALAAIFWWRLKNAPNQAEKNKMIQKGALYGLLVGIILLAAAGRIHWVGAVFAAAFPLLQGLF